MKTKRKALVAVLCAVAIVATTFMATVAWLTDTEEVLNTFTVGKVDIKLDEAVVNEKGQPLDASGNVVEVKDAARTEKTATAEAGNNYHLLPGQTYVKDPTMTVLKGSEESYVRMIVTFNKAAELKAIFGDPFLPQNLVAGWDNAKWVTTGVITADGDTLSYEFRYATPVNAKGSTADVVLEPLFASFTLPGDVTGEEIETLEGLEIKIVGHAIQVTGFEADAASGKTAVDVAWAAFDEQVEATTQAP